MYITNACILHLQYINLHVLLDMVVLIIAYNYQSTAMQQIILPTIDDPNAYKLVSVEMPRPPSMKFKTEDDLEIERLQVQHTYI